MFLFCSQDWIVDPASRYGTGMVGDPKHLSDLAKIEAALWARCRSCGHQRVFDRELLNRHLRSKGGVPAWSALAAAIPCRCGATDLSLKAMPYTREVRDPELRPHQRILVELAVAVLDGTVERGEKAQTIAVRLVLRVLLPHVMHRGVLLRIWQSGGTDNPMVRSHGLRGGVAEVRDQLRMLGRL